jgi:hypothetical protein
VAKSFDFALEEVDLLGDFGVTDRKQLFYDVVNVYFNLALHSIIILNCEQAASYMRKSMRQHH